jgi:hypothetical protein
MKENAGFGSPKALQPQGSNALLHVATCPLAI